MHVATLSTEELGDRSYLVHDGSVGVVIDPQRDIDRIQALLAEAGVSLGLVVETHIHNDYVTGGFELARRGGVPYAVNAADDVSFERRAVSDGDELTVGDLLVRIVSTPGHTTTHLSYVVTDTSAPDEPPAVFTGGSLLYGSVGRTDLVDPARTDEMTRAQFRSARRLAAELPGATRIYPTHGFGSFCSSGSSAGGQDSTIGAERARNDALTTDDEDAFVERLVAALTAYPAYYAHMAPLNRLGPGPIDLSPPAPAEPAELGKRIAAGEWVVDLRDRTAYAADHLTGSISIALGQQFATYLGWLIPWGIPLTLLGETPEQITGAQRQLVRIGIDRPAAASAGAFDTIAGGQSRRTYPVVTFDEVPAELPAGDVVLDVRRDDERADGYLPGSAHVPLHSLLMRLDDLPDGRLWVHCASGLRAGIAASLLDRSGRDVVCIDDDFSHAVDLDLSASPGRD